MPGTVIGAGGAMVSKNPVLAFSELNSQAGRTWKPVPLCPVGRAGSPMLRTDI